MSLLVSHQVRKNYYSNWF